MPIYKFACNLCGLELEKIVKIDEKVDCPNCDPVMKEMGGYTMERVLSVPSPMQWGCRRF